jgi:hypothetical protein
MYYAILAILSLGATCVAFFILLFAGGALVGLGSLGRQALRAEGRAVDVKAAVTVSTPAVRPATLPEAAKAATFVDAGATYAPA